MRKRYLPFGYQIEQGEIAIVSKESNAVRFIFEEYLAGKSLKEIADIMSAKDKLNNKIKSLKKAIEDSAARQEKASQPEMLLSAKVLQIQEYDDALTARIIEKITVRSRNEIEIRFIGGYKKTMQLT